MAKKRIAKKLYKGSEFAVILEDIKGDFKVFGESLADVKKKGDATFEAVGKLQEDVSVLKEDVSVLKEDMGIVKDELGLIRNELKAKVSRDEFNLLEKRVISLEKAVKTSRS